MAGTKNRNRLDLPNRIKGSLKRELEGWAKEFVDCCNQKIAKGIGKSPPTVRIRLAELEGKGRLEKRKFKIRTGSRVRSVFHYRQK